VRVGDAERKEAMYKYESRRSDFKGAFSEISSENHKGVMAGYSPIILAASSSRSLSIDSSLWVSDSRTNL